MAEVHVRHAIATLVRLVLDFRLFTLLVAMVSLSSQRPSPLLALLLVVVGSANLLALLRWDKVAPFLLRHPATLALDYTVTLAVLAVNGVDGPLISYTFGTAFLAGVLYGWRGAGVFSVLLVAGYTALLLQEPVTAAASSFQTTVGTPSLYLLFAAGAAAVRTLLQRQAAVETELAAVRAEAAAGAERARLAREMHDTLGKTLHGIALLSGQLPAWVARDPERAASEAQLVSEAARSAATQARELLRDLRSDRLDRPLEEAVRNLADGWSAESGVPVELRLEPVDGLTPSARYELCWVLREALRNVERHAAAQHVTVSLREDEDEVVLCVEDDGCGLATGRPDLAALAAQGHFGLVGMRERAQQAGGRVTLQRREPRGTAVAVHAPRSSGARSRTPHLTR